jgi:hypothetical protein
MQSFYVYNVNNYFNGSFSGIPVGYETRLIAYTVKNEKLFASSADVTIQQNQTITPRLRSIEEKDFESLVSGN